VASKEVFEVMGPLGKGLKVSPTGTHIAFVAGTGALPFMDLIGRLALANLDL